MHEQRLGCDAAHVKRESHRLRPKLPTKDPLRRSSGAIVACRRPRESAPGELPGTPEVLSRNPTSIHVKQTLEHHNLSGAAFTTTLSGHDTTIRMNWQNIGNKRYFAATGNSIIVQGPPSLLKLAVTMRF